MFDTPATGLLPAPTAWQTTGGRLVSPMSPDARGGRGAACSAVLHVVAALLLGRLLCVWTPTPMPPEAGLPMTMVFAPPQTGPAGQQPTPPQTMAAARPTQTMAAARPTQAMPAARPTQVAPASALPTLSSAEPQMRPRQVHATPPIRPVRDVPPIRLALRTPLAAPAAPIAAAAPTPVPEHPASPDAALLAGFTRQVQTAVQAAAYYPPVARRMMAQGRVQVRFDYSCGAVSAVSVAVPSPSPMLDRAALAAVRTASYPPGPASLKKAHLPMVVWVDFHLQGDG